ncbi:hypothetical protein [Pedobacter westerhofensis]|uniref:hypothetical protein n=1 Tax=Pedobacter westerhofensis TaxID=425512 RepID=UPI00163D6155|nr:hypothetical protein [Pedobacter westerhofensis]
MPLILCFTVYKIKAQAKHIISGYIRDAQTGKLLIGTTIRAEGLVISTQQEIILVC